MIKTLFHVLCDVWETRSNYAITFVRMGNVPIFDLVFFEHLSYDKSEKKCDVKPKKAKSPIDN